MPIATALGQLSSTVRILTAVFAAVALAVLLSSLRVPLYRLLEGYSWPHFLREFRRNKHRGRKLALKKRRDRADGQEAALALEEYRRYPEETEEISPTRLGNSIRALERYAFVRYGLDSQSLWYELQAVAPTEVVQAINNSKANVDFSVCSLYLSGVLSLSCLLTALFTDPSTELLILGSFSLITIPLWYQFAVVATDDWAYSVQALINLARKPLAQAMGLALPQTIAEERAMWNRVNWFVRGQLESKQESWLDRYRAEDNEHKDT